MPSNPILICAPSDQLRNELSSVLSAAGFAVTAVTSPPDAVASMRAQTPDLVVAEGLAASGAIGTLRSAGEHGTTPILIVAPARDVEARIAFLEAGADDVIASGFGSGELEARVAALLIRSGKLRPSSSEQANAQLAAFFSPKGGVGTTTLAVNTAVLLAGGGGPTPANFTASNGVLPPSRVLLVDLDLQFGQVTTHLNLTPRYDVAGLASDDQALADPELARAYVTQHSSGLSVLAAPTRPEADFRVTLEQLQRIVEIFRTEYDHVIVDLGGRLDPRTLWLLEQADVHVFVLFPEIAALRAASLLNAFLRETTPLSARTHIVVNHVFPKELLKTRDVENLLRTRPTAEIPYTEVEMIRAVNEGVPLVISRPTSPAALALRRVAHAVLGAEQAPVETRKERRGILGRRR